MTKALIVSSTPLVRDQLSRALEGAGVSSRFMERVDDAFPHLGESLELLFIDFCLRDGTGLELLEAAREAGVRLNVLVGDESELSAAEDLLRDGVAEYLPVPVQRGHLDALLRRAAQAEEVRQEEEKRKEERENGRFGPLVGSAPAMQLLYDRLARIAPSSARVLITGESGTGKELVARAIHEMSLRRKEPFIPTNCGAIAPTLMESELFGHEKGSFTGANRRRSGLFEQADGGTLFLDEITEMPLELQVKLLRVLETSRFRRIGGEENLRVDVRVLAATNRLPEEAIEEGKLREDLYYRLKVLHVALPPLRERLEDIGLLTRHFMEAIAQREGVERALPDGFLGVLKEHHWPGNVRELRNALYTAFLLSQGDEVEVEQLPPEVLTGAGEVHMERGVVRVPVGSTVKEAERKLILTTLASVDGHKTKAAGLLGISLKTLYNRLHSYGYMSDGEEGAGEENGNGEEKGSS